MKIFQHSCPHSYQPFSKGIFSLTFIFGAESAFFDLINFIRILYSSTARTSLYYYTFFFFLFNLSKYFNEPWLDGRVHGLQNVSDDENSIKPEMDFSSGYCAIKRDNSFFFIFFLCVLILAKVNLIFAVAEMVMAYAD